jgi:hypothetical protein
VPPNADLKLVHKAYAISDPDSFVAARDLLRLEGVLAGSSSGTLLAAALRYCREIIRDGIARAALPMLSLNGNMAECSNERYCEFCQIKASCISGTWPKALWARAAISFKSEKQVDIGRGFRGRDCDLRTQ